MAQNPVFKTRPMQLKEVALGRPLDEVLTELYHRRGMTLAEVAKELGVTTGTISRWMAAYGIAARFPDRREHQRRCPRDTPAAPRPDTPPRPARTPPGSAKSATSSWPSPATTGSPTQPRSGDCCDPSRPTSQLAGTPWQVPRPSAWSVSTRSKRSRPRRDRPAVRMRSERRGPRPCGFGRTGGSRDGSRLDETAAGRPPRRKRERRVGHRVRDTPPASKASRAAWKANKRARVYGVPGVVAMNDILALWRRQPACVGCGIGFGGRPHRRAACRRAQRSGQPPEPLQAL